MRNADWLVPLMLTACAAEVVNDAEVEYGEQVSSLTTANGLTFNGLGPNGVALNGVALNGVALNGVALNGVALTSIAFNGVALNGVALNQIFLNGVALNGVALNGVALNGVALNGVALNGVALNGVALNGVALNGTTAENFKLALKYIVECALPSGQSIQAYDLNGATLSYGGVEGHDPAWRTGVPTLSKAGVMGECVKRRASAAGVTATYSPVNTANLKTILKYLVECALPAGRTVTLRDELNANWTLSGALGLAPGWETGPLDTQGKQRVSACLAARTNAKGQSVRLSIRGPALPAAPETETTAFRWAEGAFWGDLFSATPTINTCVGKGGGISGRLCTEGSSCGFVDNGQCANINVCDGQRGDGAYTSCQGNVEVLTTFLPLGNSINVADNSNCITAVDGKVYCYGDNTWGWLGTCPSCGDYWSRAFPTLTSIPGTWVANKGWTYVNPQVQEVIRSNESMMFARLKNGSLYAWGPLWNEIQRTYVWGAKPVTGLSFEAAQLATGSCATATDGWTWCWGGVRTSDNASVQLTSLTRMDALGNESARVQGGLGEGFALTPDGTLRSWASNGGPVSTLMTGVTDFCNYGGPTYSGHTCARKLDGTVWCWGNNQYGQLGYGTVKTGRTNSVTPSSSTTPVQVAAKPGERFRARGLVCSSSTTCGVSESGVVQCWGNIAMGSADSYTIPQTTPTPVVLPAPAATISIGFSACAMLADDSVWCWGGQNTAPVLQTIADLKIVPSCGDAVCGAGETTANCPQDCGSRCGDRVCNGTENPTTCAAECSVSGDGLCTGLEDCFTSSDCRCSGKNCVTTCERGYLPRCGDGACNGTESALTCVEDC